MRCVVKLIDAGSYPYTGDLRAMHQEIFAATRRYRNFGETNKYSHRKQICQMMRGRVRKSKQGTATWYGRTTARSGQQRAVARSVELKRKQPGGLMQQALDARGRQQKARQKATGQASIQAVRPREQAQRKSCCRSARAMPTSEQDNTEFKYQLAF